MPPTQPLNYLDWDLSPEQQMIQSVVREFVEQDLYVFAGVQRGLRSRYAPRGPISAREQVMVGFNRWLVDRYRRAGRGAHDGVAHPARSTA